MLHMRKHGYYESIAADLKKEEFGSEPGAFTSKTRVAPLVVKQLAKDGGTFGIKLNQNENTALSIASTMMTMIMTAWMMFYFRLVGDYQPNAKQIHLEKQPKTPIYEEYVRDMKDQGCEAHSKSHFFRHWREAFPYVIIRVYKNVCGEKMYIHFVTY